MKTYSFRIFPNKKQVQELIEVSCIKDEIWNYFIEVQQKEYETNKKLFSVYDLHKELTKLKNNEFKHWSKLNSKACQRVIHAIDFAYKSFFNLIKKDKTAKPPHTIEINKDIFKTLVFNQCGWSFKKGGEIVEINKIPLKYKTHLKDIKEFNTKEFRVKFINSKWLCDICVQEEILKPDELTIKNKVMAFDLGLEKLATG